MKSCSECDGRLFARGLCQKHYTRMRRSGRLHRINAVQDGAGCSSGDCDRAAHAKGLCWKHYQQSRGYMRSVWQNLRTRAPGDYPPAWDAWDVFAADLDALIGERPSTKHQLRRPDPRAPWGAGNIVWRAPIGVGTKTPEDVARYQWLWHIRNRYGLSADDMQAIALAQSGMCPVCTLPLEGVERVVIDHDHEAGLSPRDAVRGLVHDRCNKGMGLLGDDADTCRRAADFLADYDKRKRARGP